jgi:hypothetical protein
MEKNGSEAFPSKHIDPYDGMSISADIWREAHEEHRQTRRAHDLVFHGSGIVYGLEVVANDPADQLVFISPGVAVDSAGYVVELVEPVAYDFGDSNQGELFLVIGHGEREIGGVDNDARYIQDEFVVAALPKMPKRPAVEIARIMIEKPGKPVKNAANPLYPLPGELDLRFRNQIGPGDNTPVLVGLVNLGGKPDKNVISGWEALASQAQVLNFRRLIINNDPSVINDLPRYGLLYCSGKGAFKLSKGDQDRIKAYLKGGGRLILEALDAGAVESCDQLLADLGVKAKPVTDGHPTLSSPFLFSGVPTGSQEGQVAAAVGVVYSTAAYSLTWSGRNGSQPTQRADLRSAHEWGLNLIRFCLE